MRRRGRRGPRRPGPFTQDGGSGRRAQAPPADTRDPPPGPTARCGRRYLRRPAKSARPAASASAIYLRRLRAARPPQAATPAFQAAGCRPGARGRRSQSERGDGGGRGWRRRPAPALTREPLPSAVTPLQLRRPPRWDCAFPRTLSVGCCLCAGPALPAVPASCLSARASHLGAREGCRPGNSVCMSV